MSGLLISKGRGGSHIPLFDLEVARRSLCHAISILSSTRFFASKVRITSRRGLRQKGSTLTLAFLLNGFWYQARTTALYDEPMDNLLILVHQLYLAGIARRSDLEVRSDKLEKNLQPFLSTHKTPGCMLCRGRS
jgi:hypothetical protein